MKELACESRLFLLQEIRQNLQYNSSYFKFLPIFFT